METILLVGTGNVGNHIIELLARESRPLEVIVGDVEDPGVGGANPLMGCYVAGEK